MKFLKKVFMCTLLAVAFGGVLAAGAVSVCHLQTDARETPLGIGMGQPEFRWQMRSDKRGAAQTAYRLTVKNEATGETVWDTGKVMSAASVGIRYAGKALLPATRYAWSVTV